MHTDNIGRHSRNQKKFIDRIILMTESFKKEIHGCFFESIPASWTTGIFIIALMKINFELVLSKIPVRLYRAA